MAPITIQALEEFFAPRISEINDIKYPSIDEIENAKLIQTFLLSSIFHGQKIKKKHHASVFYILRRIQTSVSDYNMAKEALEAFIEEKEGKVKNYTNALAHIESLIMGLYQIYQIIIKMLDKKLFEKNDGSIYDRLNKSYNAIKHFDPNNISEELIQSTYIINDGFVTLNSSISFEELKNLILEFYSLGKKIAEQKPE